MKIGSCIQVTETVSVTVVREGAVHLRKRKMFQDFIPLKLGAVKGISKG